MKRYMSEKELKRYDEISRFESIVLSIVIGLAALGLAIGMFGCAAKDAVPGGTFSVTFADGNHSLTMTSNRDVSFSKMTIDAQAGKAEILDYTGNGSNIGAQQATFAMRQSDNIASVTNNALGVVAALLGKMGVVQPITTAAPVVTTQPSK